jgi:hypothetical protein
MHCARLRPRVPRGMAQTAAQWPGGRFLLRGAMHFEQGSRTSGVWTKMATHASLPGAGIPLPAAGRSRLQNAVQGR